MITRGMTSVAPCPISAVSDRGPSVFVPRLMHLSIRPAGGGRRRAWASVDHGASAGVGRPNLSARVDVTDLEDPPASPRPAQDECADAPADAGEVAGAPGDRDRSDRFAAGSLKPEPAGFDAGDLRVIVLELLDQPTLRWPLSQLVLDA